MTLSLGAADGEESGAPAGAEEEPGGHGSLQEHQSLLHQPGPGEAHEILTRTGRYEYFVRLALYWLQL